MKLLSYLMIFFTSLSIAQLNKDIGNPDKHPKGIYFEAISFWSKDTSAVELIIPYRISTQYFSFIKKTDTQRESYFANGDLIVEILDEKEIAAIRDFRSIKIEKNSLPDENSVDPDQIQGIFTFKLKTGKYKIIFEIKDNESSKSYINKDVKVDLENITTSTLNISHPIFITSRRPETSVSGERIFYPVNYGGNIIIGQRSNPLFQIVSYDTSTAIDVKWKIISQESIDEENKQEFNGSQYQQENGIPAFATDTKHISIAPENYFTQSKIIVLPIPLERLEMGKYQLTVTLTQGINTKTGEFQFDIIWPSKPLSLSNPRIFIEALRYIATEEEIGKMHTFSPSKSMKEFLEFWHKRNPDTTSAFNTSMAEYYRRVDESIKRFSTDNETDGYLSDRGRIYILFGSPTRTNRLLKPNSAPTEIWTYEKLKRRFIFNDQKKTGNFILTKTEEY